MAAISLQDWGDAVRRRQDIVLALQWTMVIVYFALLLAPFLVRFFNGNAEFALQATRLEEALFWGVWQPAVLLATLVFGQVWCGLLCPDGTITEWVSRRGLGRKPSAWLKLAAWPALSFFALTAASEAFDAHRSALGTLIVVGGASALALAAGAVWGRGKRVWCRWLCPISSVFSLLSRCAVLHFNVDRAAWDRAPRRSLKPVDCPLLLDVRRLKSNEKCNMCGRCSGHRDAVALAVRAPGSEIATLQADELRSGEALTVAFVLIGLGLAAPHWKEWPWRPALTSFLRPDHVSAEGLIVILATSLVFGLAVVGALLLASRGRREIGLRLAYALIPLAGLGLFLAEAEHALDLLAQAGFASARILPWLRAIVVALGAAWSFSLAWKMRPSVSGSSAGAALIGGLALAYYFAPSSLL
jgi:polyferredoxin